jgi:UDP-3-O-[3-hydroxymyristoyl] glucosamine N-acyltransferase
MSVVLKLTDVTRLVPLEVVADAEFETLGFLSDRLPGMLTFLEDRRFLPGLVLNRRVAAVITNRELAGCVPKHLGVCIASRPRRAFVSLHNALAAYTDFYGVSHPTLVDPTARVHPRAVIAEENVQIGPEVIVEANAIIGPGCTLERAVVVRSGAVLGASGFQTCRDEEGYLEMTHAGALLVEERAQIFSNATIARGLSRQTTRIGADTRVGNNTFISHNVDIGPRCFIGHGAVVNGNTSIGRQVWIGPGAVIANSLTNGTPPARPYAHNI